MPTTEELLAQLEAEAQTETPVCVIDPETRTITVPPEYQLLGVENDKRVERITFRCPKIVGDNQDLSQNYQLFINYQNANGDPDAYHVEDMEVDGDNITFSWLLEENVTKYRGDIQFAFGAIIPGDEANDPDKSRWNTTINTDCTVLTGLKSTQQVAESNPDALAQIWAAIDELKAGGGGGSYTLPIMSDTQLGGGKAISKTDEDVPVAVDTETGQLFVPTYPLQGGITEEQKQQLEQNTQDITDLKNTLSKTNFGWTNQQIVLLQSLFDYLVYSDQETGQSIADSLIYSLKNNTEIPDEPEEPENPEEIYYNITYSLENVTSDNNETRIKKGESYIANLSPSSGYYINSVTITMGGENITSTVYSDGVINISSVNGEIMILAKGAESDNLIKLSECTSNNEKMPDGSVVTEGEMLVTPLIKVTPNTIYKTNISRHLSDSSVTYNQKIFTYNDLQVFMRVGQLNSNVPYQTISNASIKEGEYYARILFSVKNENPYFGISGVIV